jgi:hypothetical protein
VHDHLGVPPGVAEDLDRGAEDLGEERRHRVVAAFAACEDLADLRALVIRVRPVLDAATLLEERVVEAGDVAGRIHVRHVALEPLVDDDPVVQLDAAPVEEGRHRLDADADDREIGLDFAAVLGRHPREGAVAVECPDFVAEDELDAFLLVQRRQFAA